MPIIDKIKDAKFIVILISAVIILWLIYKIVFGIIDSTNRSASENNVAVAVKAKEELKQATEQLNKAAEDMKAIQEKLAADELLREKNKEITESNKKELEKVIEKIDTINNNDTTNVETEADRMKSKLIIDSIWGMYEGAKNDK